MKVVIQSKVLLLAVFISLVLIGTSSIANFVSPSPIWERNVSHVFLCSDVDNFFAEDLEAFYVTVSEVSAQFINGWNEIDGELPDYNDVVIVSIASQAHSDDLESCLSEIPFFKLEWFDVIAAQAREIGTVPEYLARSPLGESYEPVRKSWTYRYSSGVVFASYIYQTPAHFSYEDAVRGALQFEGSNDILSEK